MNLTYKRARSLPFGSGRLSVEFGYDPIAAKCYDGGAPTAFRMMHEEGEKVEKLDSFADLIRFAMVNQIALEAEVSGNSRPWADVIFLIDRFFKDSATKSSGLSDVIAVTSDTQMHRESYSKRGVLPDEMSPSVANGVLTWHAIKMEEGGSVLLKYQCDLKSFDVSSSSIRRL